VLLETRYFYRYWSCKLAISCEANTGFVIFWRGWAILKMFEWWIQYHPGLGRGRSEIHPRDRNRFPKTDQWTVPAPHTSGTLGPRHVCAQWSNASYVTDWFYVKERLYNGVDVWRRRGKWLENNESKAPAIHCRALCPIRAIFYRFAAPRASWPKTSRPKNERCGNLEFRFGFFRKCLRIHNFSQIPFPSLILYEYNQCAMRQENIGTYIKSN